MADPTQWRKKPENTPHDKRMHGKKSITFLNMYKVTAHVQSDHVTATYVLQSVSETH